MDILKAHVSYNQLKNSVQGTYQTFLSLQVLVVGSIWMCACVCASARINQSQGRALRLCCVAVICPAPRPFTHRRPPTHPPSTFVTFEVEINSKMQIKSHSARGKRKMLKVRGKLNDSHSLA